MIYLYIQSKSCKPNFFVLSASSIYSYDVKCICRARSPLKYSCDRTLEEEIEFNPDLWDYSLYDSMEELVAEHFENFL